MPRPSFRGLLTVATAAALTSSGACAPDEVRGDADGLACAADGLAAGRIGFLDNYPEGSCPAPIVADEPLTLQVLFELGSRMTKDDHAACTVELEGNTIHLRSQASWSFEDGLYDGTYALVATCTTPPLPAGSYTIVFGDEQYELAVPSSPCSPCFPRTPNPDPASAECCEGAIVCGGAGCN